MPYGSSKSWDRYRLQRRDYDNKESEDRALIRDAEREARGKIATVPSDHLIKRKKKKLKYTKLNEPTFKNAKGERLRTTSCERFVGNKVNQTKIARLLLNILRSTHPRVSSVNDTIPEEWLERVLTERK